MKRLVVKARIVTDTIDLHAAGESPTPDRWWTALNVDLRTVIELVGVVITLFSIHATNQSHFAAIDKQAEADHAAILQLRADLSDVQKNLQKNYVQRPELEDHWHDESRLLNGVQEGQQQIYTLMLQGGFARRDSGVR